MSEAVRNRSWRPAVPLMLVLAALGVATGSTPLIVAAVIPFTFLVYGALSSPPSGEDLEVSRSLETGKPSPGQEIEVTLRLRNTGGRTIPDARVIDGVPEDLAVVDGSPRGSVALRPDGETEITYRVLAKRGEHFFGPAEVELRSLSGGSSRTCEKDVSGEEEMNCFVGLHELPLRDETVEYSGEISTAEGGSGVEFHSVREYRPADPLNRIDWNHLAKDDELNTVNFREQHSARIVLLVDARDVSDRRPVVGHPTGTDLSVYAAERMFDAVQETRHQAGVAVLGMEDHDFSEDQVHSAYSVPWVKPGGRSSREKTENLLQEIYGAEKTGGGSGEEYAQELYGMLPPDSQVVLFSPLLDDELIDTVKVLNSNGHKVTVVSPAMATGGTIGQDLESLERELRLDDLRRFSPVIDWDIETPLQLTVVHALKTVFRREVYR
ncbi:MAG: DUF58 domain-containing protein [Candidatus Nanohaloarchaea archaeon]